MNTLGGYFVNNEKDLICNKDNIIQGKKFRISILTDRLIRLEYSNSGNFVDKATERVVFRNFPKVKYSVDQVENLIQVTTEYFSCFYDKEKSFLGSKVNPSSNLKINLNGTDRIWFYNNPEVRNYGTINYSLDDFKGKLKLSNGLYSTDGFAALDDSDSMIVDSKGNYIKRNSGDIDVYVFLYRKDLGLCFNDYFMLTGNPQLIPRYALGNWWYKNEIYDTNKILSFFKNMNELEIPVSVFMLGDKCSVTRDNILINNNLDLRNERFNNVYFGYNYNPSDKILSNTATFQKLSEYNNDGDYISFLPIENNKLNLYSSYVIPSLINQGINVINLSYNNISDKNSLGILNSCHYAYNALKFNKRSAILTRNHNVSIHRDGIVFTGYTIVDWNTLSVLPRYNSSASNMGISYVASAIGGYYKGIENFELYIRYIQLGVFSSILLLASDGGEYYKREPWRFSVSEREIMKKYLNLRVKLIPYIYTEAYLYHKVGSPLIQPLYYKYPKIYDEPLYINEYFFGSQMLVCPITKKKNVLMNRVVQRMFLPDGIWYEFDSGKKYIGNKYYMSFYSDDEYPVFCKAGSIIVMSLDKGIDNPVNLEVDVFPGASFKYNLYEDDGISNNFKNGSYAVTEFNYVYNENKIELVITPKGNIGLLPSVRNYKIKFRNINSASISVNDGVNNINASASLVGNDLVVDIIGVSSGRKIIINCTGDNLENSTLSLINDDIRGILEDLEIETLLKVRIDEILFSDLSIKKKRIEIRKLKRKGLEPKFIKMFINLLEYINTV